MFLLKFLRRLPGLVSTKSLNQRFVLLVAVMGAPFLVYVIVNAANQARVERDDAQHEALGVARQVATRLDDHIFHMQTLLGALSPNVSFGPDARAANQTFLDKEAHVIPKFVSNVALWDLDGRCVGSIDPAARSLNIVDRGYFTTVIKTRAFVVEAPVISRANGHLIAQFAVPLTDDHGEVRGVITASTDLLELQQLVRPEAALPSDALISIIDEKGIILARSTDPSRWIGESISHTANFDANRGVSEGLSERDGIDGVPRVAAFSVATRVPWRAFVGVPASTIYGPARRHATQAIAFGSCVLLLSFLIAWRIGKSVSGPIDELAAEARQFENGNLRDRRHSYGPEEVAQLARAIHHMADSLLEREAAAARSERWLRQITDSVPALIAYVDTNHHYLFANRFYADLLGCDTVAMIGRTVHQVQGEKRYEATAAYFKQALNGQRVTFEHSTVLDDGSARELLATYIPDISDAGPCWGCSFSIKISQR